MSLIAIFLLFIPLIFIAIIIKITSKGPILFYSKRFGKDDIFFYMPKFRTMILTTPDLPTHKLKNYNKYVTPIGKFLRKYSLDELPQIFCILHGSMSFVGPRPALHNQIDLISLRRKKNINKLLPGVTGLAQINGRDDLSIPKKVEYEYEYVKKKSLLFDICIIIRTFNKVLNKEGVSH